jgi:hypothetical protein
MKISHVCLFISILIIGYILCSREYFSDVGGVCPAGSWCPGSTIAGKTFVCPAGTYGSEKGLSSPKCSGYCTKGYWCNSGSITATQNLCPAGYFCVEGSTNLDGSAPPILCPAGYYCPAGSSSPIACPSGYYCPEGTQDITATKK